MIWYIDEDLTTGLNDGSSWANAFKSVTIDAVPIIGEITEDSSIILRSTGIIDIQRDFGGISLSTFTLDITLEAGSELYFSTGYDYPVTLGYSGNNGTCNVYNFNVKQEANGYGIRTTNGNTQGVTNMFNTIVSGGGTGIYSTGAGIVNVYGTVINTADRAVRNTQSGTINMFNAYASGIVAAYVNSGAGIINLTTCASNDTSGSVGLQNIPYAGTTFTDVTPGTEDYHLILGSPLIGTGTVDISTVDFVGDIWGSPRDIGVYTYSEASGGYVFIPTNMDGGFTSLDGGF